MSSIKLALGCLFVFFIGGCSMLNPFVDRRRNPGVQDLNKLYSGPSKPEAPAICYNALWSGDEDLQDLATAECVKHGTGNYAQFVKKEYFNGKLLLPHHAYYKCVMKKD